MPSKSKFAERSRRAKSSSARSGSASSTASRERAATRSSRSRTYLASRGPRRSRVFSSCAARRPRIRFTSSTGPRSPSFTTLGGFTRSCRPKSSIIDFYQGNFSTQFGRAMGAIIDVGLATPKADKLHAMVEANLIDARFIVQGPVFDTGWRFSVGGRRSYVDTWLGPVLTAAGANVSVAPGKLSVVA